MAADGRNIGRNTTPRSTKGDLVRVRVTGGSIPSLLLIVNIHMTIIELRDRVIEEMSNILRSRFDTEENYILLDRHGSRLSDRIVVSQLLYDQMEDIELKFELTKDWERQLTEDISRNTAGRPFRIVHEGTMSGAIEEFQRAKQFLLEKALRISEIGLKPSVIEELEANLKGILLGSQDSDEVSRIVSVLAIAPSGCSNRTSIPLLVEAIPRLPSEALIVLRERLELANESVEGDAASWDNSIERTEVVDRIIDLLAAPSTSQKLNLPQRVECTECLSLVLEKNLRTGQDAEYEVKYSEDRGVWDDEVVGMPLEALMRILNSTASGNITSLLHLTRKLVKCCPRELSSISNENATQVLGRLINEASRTDVNHSLKSGNVHQFAEMCYFRTNVATILSVTAIGQHAIARGTKDTSEGLDRERERVGILLQGLGVLPMLVKTVLTPSSSGTIEDAENLISAIRRARIISETTLRSLITIRNVQLDTAIIFELFSEGRLQHNESGCNVASDALEAIVASAEFYPDEVEKKLSPFVGPIMDIIRDFSGVLRGHRVELVALGALDVTLIHFAQKISFCTAGDTCDENLHHLVSMLAVTATPDPEKDLEVARLAAKILGNLAITSPLCSERVLFAMNTADRPPHREVEADGIAGFYLSMARSAIR